MARSRAALGRIGEQVAVRHLERCGYTLVARNWRCADAEVRGELDLIAWDGPTLVICEVKARRGEATGGPLAAVTPAKRARLRRLALAFLAAGAVRPAELRFDVIGVCWPAGGGRAVLEHLRGAC